MSAAKSRIAISSPLPRFTASTPSYFSVASRRASTQSPTYRNSRVGLPSPHRTMSWFPRSRASTVLRRRQTKEHYI